MLCLRQLTFAGVNHSRGLTLRSLSSSSPRYSQVETDDLAIPLTPTWSVHNLLSSYPSPKISAATLQKLYNLSALDAPAEGTPQHETVKTQLQEMIRMVEAVKLVDTTGVVVSGNVGGVGMEEDMDRKLFGNPTEQRNGTKQGKELLEHAARTENEFYVVETDRTRGPSE